MKAFCLCSFLLLATVHGWAQQDPPLAAAAAPAEPVAPKVSLEMQCISLPQALAIPLIRKFRSGKEAEQADANNQLAQLLEKGTAKLLAWPLITTNSGQKAMSEAIDEYRFPVDFAIGTAAIYLSEQDGTVTKQPKEIRGLEMPPAANNFASRHLGFTLQAEPTVAYGGKSVQIAFVAEHNTLKSIEKWTVEHETTEKKTEKVTQEQPRFATFKAENVIDLQSGEHKLVGIFKTTDVEPTLELFILGAEILGKPKTP